MAGLAAVAYALARPGGLIPNRTFQPTISNDMRLIEFETDRLHLRQWRKSDRTAFAALNADPEVMAYFPDTLSRIDSDAMAARCEALIAARGWGFWAVEVLEGSEFIGFVGLHTPAPELPCSPCVEIGWRLARSQWGKGLATEAARGALYIGFEELGLAEIVSFTTLENQRSRAVMEKLGMQPDDQGFDHPAFPEGHPLAAHCLYRLRRARWVADRAGASERPAPQPGTHHEANND